MSEGARGRGRLVLMLGPSMNYPGGMTAVIRSYRAAAVFERWPVRYISTYAGRRLVAKLAPWAGAVTRVFVRLARRRVALIHVHSTVHGSFWRKSVLCALAFAFRVPYVVHLHTSRLEEFERGCHSLARRWLRFILREAARVVVLTSHWGGEVRRIEPAARISIVGNPVSVPAALPAMRTRPARTVLFLNWLLKEKGVLDLVAAIPAVLRAVPDASFVVAGRGIAGSATPESIGSLASRLGVERALRLPGWVDGDDAKGPLLRAADLFVLPSYAEALPVSVLEAMAHGVPVLATRVGGIPDVIAHGVNGFLVDAGEPEALAQAIVALLTDAALRARLREAAYRDVRRRYSVQTVLGELEALYRSLGVELG